jgi:hypothetical protein
MPASSTRLTAAKLTTEVLAPDVIITHFRGHITKELAQSQLSSFRIALARTATPNWIMNLSEMTGFDPGAVAAGTEWFKQLKQCNGYHILLVSTQAAARMAAATVSFSVGLKVQTFQSLERALLHLGLKPPSQSSAGR